MACLNRMMSAGAATLWLMAACVSAAAGAGVAESALSDSRAIVDLNSQVLQAEIEFAELNTSLYRQTLPRSAWMARRWFLYQVANSSLTAAGALVSGAGHFSYLHRGRINRAPRDLFERAAWLRVDANTTSVGGSLLEIALDRLADARDRRHAVDLPTLKRHETILRSHLDRLLQQRAFLIGKATLKAAVKDEYSRESQVFNDISDLCTAEFQRFLTDATASRVRLAVQHGLTLAANAASGACSFTGSIYALQQNRCTSRWRTRLGAASGVGDVVAGSLNTMAPLVIDLADKFVRRHRPAAASQAACRQLIDKLDEDRKKCWQLAAPAANDRKIVDVVAAVLESDSDMAEAYRLSARHNQGERNMVNTIAGGSKITNGIGGLLGSLRDTGNAHERFEVFGGTNCAYGSAYCLLTLDLLRNQVETEIHAARQRRRHSTPYQIIDDHIASLEAIKLAPAR